MSKTSLEYSKSQLAKLLGISRQGVDGLVDKGMPVKKRAVGRGGYVLDGPECVEWWVQYQLDRFAPDPEQRTTDDERKRLLAAQADKQEIQNAQQRGQLISVEQVAGLVGLGARLRTETRGAAGKIAKQVARESNPAVCKRLILDGVSRALVNFADGVSKLAKSQTYPL